MLSAATKSKSGKSYILTPLQPSGMWCQRIMSNPSMNLKSKFGYIMTTQTL